MKVYFNGLSYRNFCFSNFSILHILFDLRVCFLQIKNLFYRSFTSGVIQTEVRIDSVACISLSIFLIYKFVRLIIVYAHDI